MNNSIKMVTNSAFVAMILSLGLSMIFVTIAGNFFPKTLLLAGPFVCEEGTIPMQFENTRQVYCEKQGEMQNGKYIKVDILLPAKILVGISFAVLFLAFFPIVHWYVAPQIRDNAGQED